MVFYRPLNQVVTRVTSYSVNNMAPVPENAEGSGVGDPLMSPAASRPSRVNAASAISIRDAPSLHSVTRLPSHAHRRSLSGASAASGGKSSTKSRRPPRRSLSVLLMSATPTTAGGDEVVYVALKALPVDHTLQERENAGSSFTQPRHSDFERVDRTVGKTCKEVVDDVCAQLVEACDNVGLEGDHLLIEKDVVRWECCVYLMRIFPMLISSIRRSAWKKPRDPHRSLEKLSMR